jgi:hypothetical protein
VDYETDPRGRVVFKHIPNGEAVGRGRARLSDQRPSGSQARAVNHYFHPVRCPHNTLAVCEAEACIQSFSPLFVPGYIYTASPRCPRG